MNMLPNQVTKSLVPKTAVIGIIAGVGVLAEPVQAAILQAQVDTDSLTVLDISWRGGPLDIGGDSFFAIPNLDKGLPENKIPNKKIEKCFFEKVIIFV
ncbi:hypothetical protein [Microcystis aeruginosa]|jgi:hypothetical protein|nr:hypothetical protein [Microcystis aeruginosa]